MALSFWALGFFAAGRLVRFVSSVFITSWVFCLVYLNDQVQVVART
jgi:hypothetical protein